jgi:hypothetical protein
MWFLGCRVRRKTRNAAVQSSAFQRTCATPGVEYGAPPERARVPVRGYGQVDAEWALNAFDIARSVRNKQ